MDQHVKATPISKRIFDLIFSIVVAVILSPVLIIIAIIIVVAYGFPIFFQQIRPGKDGIPFILYKFRSMEDKYDMSGKFLPDEERITKFGNFLRRFSLDELPELFNIVRGEMSIVGPRPLLMQYLERYSPEQARRHEVLPGMTGWAQVNGRNAISWEEKFRLDVWYIDHWSFCFDVKIILLTIWKVIKGEGISQSGRATMDEFMGDSTE